MKKLLSKLSNIKWNWLPKLRVLFCAKCRNHLFILEHVLGYNRGKKMLDVLLKDVYKIN